MKLILRDHVEGLGGRGTVVEVKEGYARNYLLPKGLALPASEASMRRIEAERKRIVVAEASAHEEAAQLAERMRDVSLTLAKKVGENQELFGSVTVAEIAEKLSEAGFEIDRKLIRLNEPIRKLGIYDVTLELHHEVQPVVKVWVVKEE
ncbi:MAG: 50S ribosomal protein L9 [Acidobacteriota bacterium]|nr:MAG: 50S ribosomal protein L9 [Acidobacteriota bacterium]